MVEVNLTMIAVLLLYMNERRESSIEPAIQIKAKNTKKGNYYCDH
jgi:hypothetical protein